VWAAGAWTALGLQVVPGTTDRQRISPGAIVLRDSSRRPTLARIAHSDVSACGVAYLSLATDPQGADWQLIGRRRGEISWGVGGASMLVLPINLILHHVFFNREWEVVVLCWPSATGRVAHRQRVPSEAQVEATLADVARRIDSGDLPLP
jgi:hypothetical protein